MQDSVHVRWMIRRDMPAVLYIEQVSFEFPWSEADFIRCLRQRNTIGFVAERAEEVVGLSIYSLHSNRIALLNFAVDPWHRRRGVGRAMIDNLTGKLSAERRRRIGVTIRERNLPGQLFLQAMGFRASQIVRAPYEDTDEDGIVFRYQVTQDATARG